MSGTDKREAMYTQARDELMHELVRANAFDMNEHDRGANVSRIVRGLKRKYPDLDDQMERRLVGEGMQRTYGDASWNETVRKRRQSP